MPAPMCSAHIPQRHRGGISAEFSKSNLGNEWPEVKLPLLVI